jgi:hypothetical protein
VSFDEAAWWGDCANTFHEEQKQLVYARRMGLVADWTVAHPPVFRLDARQVIDIGGGPCSLLLKTEDAGRSVVMDPATYPAWVSDRYAAHGVELWRQPGEELDGYTFDEAWVYNTLQHVRDPAEVIARARRCAGTVRLFEWLDIPPYDGHPHMLTEAALNEWLGLSGFTTTLNESGAVGRAYYGVFPGA